jgi:phosphoglycolate phosphatase
MIKGLLFDLDGTLLDSAPDLVGSLNFLRAQQGLGSLPVRKMESAASAGAVGLLQAGMPKADADTVERWRLAFLEHYQQNSFTHSTLFDGAAELISYLQSHSMPWGIVTNKPEYLTHPILAAAKLDNLVTAVVCGDTIEEKKPHPAPVLHACELLRLDPEQVLFVGDDPRDLEAGAAAGVMNCAAMYGYGSRQFQEPAHGHLLKAGISIEKLGNLLDWLRAGRGQDHPR